MLPILVTSSKSRTRNAPDLPRPTTIIKNKKKAGENIVKDLGKRPITSMD